MPMEIEKVQKLLMEVAPGHPKADDSAELKALRNISLALLHMAEGVQDIQKTQANAIAFGRGPPV